MSGLYAVLDQIKKRPSMYLGKPSITVLHHFLLGYEFARNELEIDLTEDEVKFYREFQPWIQAKFKVNTSKSWDNIILLFCQDEKEGFERFFRLLDEFLGQYQLQKEEVIV